MWKQELLTMTLMLVCKYQRQVKSLTEDEVITNYYWLNKQEGLGLQEPKKLLTNETR